ncbi:hypothetical protein GALMADRAFT_1320361 [Galerina marginata CBS 339.88]|uniref:Uncharacterized protein n=1 Tax=Galerina marginata (strain CBS 339.88) TaxID=685588 RepID=A0A067S3E8_GALM3|nr:hypothetical protein GALMADRAFT_1320361 [Galerina marginata CBS 339.88]
MVTQAESNDQQGRGKRNRWLDGRTGAPIHQAGCYYSSPLPSRGISVAAAMSRHNYRPHRFEPRLPTFPLEPPPLPLHPYDIVNRLL